MIELIDVTLRRGSFQLPKTSFVIPSGQCGVITGSAGAGKTSIVEAICGLQPIETGKLILRNQDATKMSVGERTIGYLPQDVMLFPQMTVRGNIEFGPKANRWSKKAMDDRIQTLSKELELVDLLNRRPHQLSGGQQKRVAMARALSLNPDVVCLDEPFVSLDDHSKELIKQSLRQVLSQKSATVLVVTHQPQWLVGISNVEFQI